MPIRRLSFAFLLSGCTVAPALAPTTDAVTESQATSPTTGLTTASPEPAPSAGPDAIPPNLSPSTSPPVFSGGIEPLTPEQLPHSWREGCPVSPDQLRLLRVSHWGYDGAAHQGELVINAAHAEQLVGVFEQLFAAGFPIERMQSIDAYRGDDNLSMAANNTSGFNCREVADRPGVWSQHAFGNAIDLNPLVNPYLRADGEVLPPEGTEFTDRTIQTLGLIAADSVAVQAFAAIGWSWGGNWANPDFQHFSATGT